MTQRITVKELERIIRLRQQLDTPARHHNRHLTYAIQQLIKQLLIPVEDRAKINQVLLKMMDKV